MARSRILKTTVAGLLTGAATLASPGALAQLEEIFVTAERREASVQDVPIAVSAYGEQLMEDLQLEDTIDLINVVPNLFGGNNTGLGTANMYYLRAQGNDESIATFDPPVGTYVDDIYITRQNANNFSLFDVERIEVLRGPQGTLYGRNTTGGAISLVMRKPGDTLGGYLEAGFGSFDKVSVRGSIDLPVSPTLLTKLSFFKVDSDGYLDNLIDGKTYNGEDSMGVRGAIRFMPSDNVTWDLSIDFMDLELANIYGDIVGGDRVSTSQLTGGLPATSFGAPNGFVQKSSLYGNKVEALNGMSNLAIAMGSGTLNLILGLRDFEQDFLVNLPNALSDDFFAIDNVGEHMMTSAEVKWSGDVGSAYLTTGVYYMDEENTTDFADYLDLGVLVGAPPAFGIINLANRVLKNSTESVAVYAQADIPVGERGTLTVGARHTQETKRVGFSGSITTAQLVAAGTPIEQKERKLTPRFAYAYKVSEDIMTYVSMTQGFKSGGWNARSSTGATALPFGPEEIWSYEAGMRGEFMDGRLRANVTAFHSDVSDLQTTSATPSGAFLTTNAAGMEVTGLEAEVFALPTDNWQIFFAAGLQNPQYTDLPDGCTVPNTDYAAFDDNCKPADPKRSPKSTFTLGTTVTVPMGNLVLTPTASVRYIGKNVTGTRNLGANPDSVTIVNAGVSLGAADDRWSLNVECKNCTDETYVTSSLFVDYYNMPRTYGATLRWNFGE